MRMTPERLRLAHRPRPATTGSQCSPPPCPLPEEEGKLPPGREARPPRPLFPSWVVRSGQERCHLEMSGPVAGHRAVSSDALPRRLHAAMLGPRPMLWAARAHCRLVQRPAPARAGRRAWTPSSNAAALDARARPSRLAGRGASAEASRKEVTRRRGPGAAGTRRPRRGQGRAAARRVAAGRAQWRERGDSSCSAMSAGYGLPRRSGPTSRWRRHCRGRPKGRPATEAARRR